MATVRHRVGIGATAHKIFECLTLPEQLSAWWSTGATGEATVGSQIDLEFVGLTHLVFKVDHRDEDARIALTCVDGPEIWIGSQLAFDLTQSDAQQVYVTLTHSKAEADDDAFLYFNTKWPLFLVSLKELAETGSGRPFPNDVKIDHNF
jgi:uncharacterized protein YndB with AHSA1/START domain